MDLVQKLRNAAQWADAMHTLWESRGRTDDFKAHAVIIREGAAELERYCNAKAAARRIVEKIDADEDVESRERYAKIAENPGFIECRDTDWDDGVNFAKKFIAAKIRES